MVERLIAIAPTLIGKSSPQWTKRPAATGTARVTLDAQLAAAGTTSWPSVQVAFVVETTFFDGVADGGSGDIADHFEESNGVPFFVKNAGEIASEIQSAHVGSKVSFALVDYFATINDHDDADAP